MKCPICGKDVDLQKKQVGVDEQGAPVFHQYAICRDCKKQWDLDKQRARKATPDTMASAGKTETAAVKPEKASKEETAPDAGSKRPVPKKGPAGEEKRENKTEGSTGARPVRKKTASGQAARQNISQENTDRKKEVLTEKKTAHKAGEGEELSTVKAPRKQAPGTVSPEKKARNPQVQKASSEKAEGSRQTSGKRPSRGPASEKVSAERTVSGKTSAERTTSGKPPVKKRPSGESARPESEAVAKATSKKKPVRKSAAESEEQRYGNIPPEKVRVKKEHAVKQGYEDMLSADPSHKPKKKKRPVSDEDVQPAKKERPVPAKQRPVPKSEMEDEHDEYDMDFEEMPAKFHILRIIFGMISILAAGFFAYGGFFEGLENIASGSTISTGTTFLIFAICMLVSGLLLLIMQNRNTILAFILPMIFYFGAAVFTFLKRQDKQMFLYCAIASAVFGFIFLILGIVSRNSNGDDGDDDYDDPFEDDYE